MKAVQLRSSTAWAAGVDKRSDVYNDSCLATFPCDDVAILFVWRSAMAMVKAVACVGDSGHDSECGRRVMDCVMAIGNGVSGTMIIIQEHEHNT